MQLENNTMRTEAVFRVWQVEYTEESSSGIHIVVSGVCALSIPIHLMQITVSIGQMV